MALPASIRERIMELAEAGETRNAIARQVGCSPGTVTNIARAEGFDFAQAASKKAQQASRDYGQANRLALLNRGFDKLSALLDEGVETVAQAQTWTVAVATLIDKRRLEDGEATSRTDDISTGTARELVTRRLDELAVRRRSRPDIGGSDRSAVS